MSNESDAKEEGKSFWVTVPGILAQIAAVIVAITGLVVALDAAGLVPSCPSATPATSPTSAFASGAPAEDTAGTPPTSTSAPEAPAEDTAETPPTLTSAPEAPAEDTAKAPPTLTFTPEVPATPTPCDLPVDSQFVALWDRDRLGCAIEPVKSVNLAQEPFERGYMLWREDLRRIYVLYNDGTWQWFRDTWEEGQPEYTCPESASSKTPPTPYRGFGKVWCQESGVRDKIGQAEDKEKGYTGVIQTFQRGLIVTSDRNGIYILYDDGTWGS